MSMTFEAFLWALTQQESGGNYGAVGVWVGGDRAYGRYQVMGANIPSWTKKYYGRSLTPTQYLNNRAAQDAVVRGVLGGYVKKYGYRGAASAWYSGNPNLHNSTRSQPGGPSIKGYVDSVMNRAAGYTGGGGSTGGSGGTAVAVPKLSSAELAEQYGLSSALINSSKELKGLFNKAVTGSWSGARFQASLKNTKWWKTQSSTLRKYITIKFTDPATFKQNWASGQAKVNQLAVQVGLASQINSKGQSSQLLRDAIYRSVALGWSDARIKNYLGTRVATHDGVMWGEAGEYFDKLHEVAYLNGMKYGRYFEQAARGIARGVTTLETEEAKIRQQAAARYAPFRDQILAGQNVMDLAAPYIKATSSILELAETDIDLFNPHIARAMTAKPAAGAAAGTQMPLWQFENDLRNDPLWKKTNNARESMMTTARAVAKDFGMAW
ncbi:hypothetical protein ACWC0A_30520 [Streptomyces scopuliridis]